MLRKQVGRTFDATQCRPGVERVIGGNEVENGTIVRREKKQVKAKYRWKMNGN